MLANLVLVHAIGVDTLLRAAQANEGRQSNLDDLSPELIGVYGARSLVMLVGLLTISTVLWVVLQAFRRSLWAGQSLEYVVVLAICSYAAYVREVLRLIITLAVVAWHQVFKVPLTSGRAIQTNAAAFLHVPISHPLFSLSRSLDVLMFGFLGLVTVELWKAIPNLPLHRAASAVVVTWLIYLGLALIWES